MRLEPPPPLPRRPRGPGKEPWEPSREPPSLSSSELITSRTAAAAAAAATAALMAASPWLGAMSGEGRQRDSRPHSRGGGGSERALSRLEVPGMDCERSR